MAGVSMVRVMRWTWRKWLEDRQLKCYLLQGLFSAWNFSTFFSVCGLQEKSKFLSTKPKTLCDLYSLVTFSTTCLSFSSATLISFGQLDTMRFLLLCGLSLVDSYLEGTFDLPSLDCKLLPFLPIIIQVDSFEKWKWKSLSLSDSVTPWTI